MEGDLILGRYRPLAEAGAGGYGTVVLAWDTRIKRRVAIKQLVIDQDAFPELAEWEADYDGAAIPGLEEARTAAMLQDQNIVGVLDFELQGGVAYLIMEYVDGLTLTQLLREFPEDVTLDVVAAVFGSVAHALEVAHENQVLHLDIKPDNILINRQGEVKVSDFGLARLSSAAGFSQAAGGTIGYMPPEQMRLEPLDARCDEWSLAAITYEMLVRQNPFWAPDLKHAEAAIVHAELVLPSIVAEGLDTEADDVLFYALDPDRKERYESVQDFAEEMLPFLGDAALGKRQLAELVNEASEDFADAEGAGESAAPRGGLFTQRGGVLMRLWAALNCGTLALVGASCLGASGAVPEGAALPLWVLTAVVLVFAILLPHVGSVLALLLFSACVALTGAPLMGAVLAAVSALWWFAVARHGHAQANTALSVVPLGAVGLGALAPVLAGYTLRPRQALSNAALSSVLAFCLADAGTKSICSWDMLSTWGNAAFSEMKGLTWDMLAQSLAVPGIWVDAVSWIIAALVFAALCSFAVRPVGVLGGILAGVVLIAATLARTWLGTNGIFLSPGVGQMVLACVPLAVGCIAAAAYIPFEYRDYSEEFAEDIAHTFE